MKTTLILILFPIITFSQYWGGQEIKESDLSPWIPKFEIEYQGVYHFGESESESDLIIFFTGKFLIGQIKYGYWEENTGIWKTNFKTLTNLTIDQKGKFKSDEHSGQFIKYKTENGELLSGLRIDNPWTSWIKNSEFEIGTQSEFNHSTFFAGKYPETSTRELNPSRLRNLKSKDLRIMRNEIFARYGYQFKKEGKMEKYFKAQKWYREEHQNIGPFLTKIELYNIDLIKKIEKEKNK